VLGKGLALMIGSPATFLLATNTGLASKDGGSRFFPNRENNREVGGGTIALELDMFPPGRVVGGVGATPETTLAHEVGHGVASILGGFAMQINGAIALSKETFSHGEGYAVAFENRYRAEIGASKREYYNQPGDLFLKKSMRVFPEE